MQLKKISKPVTRDTANSGNNKRGVGSISSEAVVEKAKRL
jgi:hypothetical protein